MAYCSTEMCFNEAEPGSDLCSTCQGIGASRQNTVPHEKGAPLRHYLYQPQMGGVGAPHIANHESSVSK